MPGLAANVEVSGAIMVHWQMIKTASWRVARNIPPSRHWVNVQNQHGNVLGGAIKTRFARVLAPTFNDENSTNPLKRTTGLRSHPAPQQWTTTAKFSVVAVSAQSSAP